MLKIQPNLPIAAENLNKTNSNDDLNNLGFMAIFQSLQPTEGNPLNIDGLLNQTIKKDVSTSPKFKSLLGQIPQNVLSEFNKLVGKPVKQILSDNTVSPEAKAVSLFIASFQMKPKGNETTIPNRPVTPIGNEPIKAIENTTATELSSNSVNLIKTQKTEIESIKATNLLTMSAVVKATDFSSMKKEVGITNPAFINKPNIKNLSNEPQSYGEFKLERTNIPVIQLNMTDTPQQTQQNFLKQFETILKSARFSQVAKNHSQMTIQLNPKNLGYMTIKVEQVDQEIVARIITSSTTTKELLESNLHHLKHLNIQVDKFEVNIQQQNNTFMREDNQSKQQSNQQSNQEQNDDNEQPTQSFEEQLAKIMP